MREFPRPRIVLSRCLELEACRYDGGIIRDDFVRRLLAHVEVIAVCPELELGLGVPRPPARVVREGETLRLLQPDAGRDLTSSMTDFAHHFMSSLPAVDGFLLKSRSPSCGWRDVKVYGSGNSGPARVPGFFGSAVLQRFPSHPVEDEGRLRSFRIREHFLVSIFTRADFRGVLADGSPRALVDFHSRNKYLFMAYHQTLLKAMGRLVAGQTRRSFADTLDQYQPLLHRLLERPPRVGSYINVLMHQMGYFSPHLSGAEKQFFLDALQQYRQGRVPLSVPLALIRAMVSRFDEPYLRTQTLFEPFPPDLVDIADSGKGRER